MSKSTRHDDVSGGGSLYTPPSQGDEDDPLDSYGAARVNSADSLGSTRAHSGNFVDKGYRKRLLECSDVEDDVTTLCVTPWGRSATFDNRLSRWMNKAERRMGAVAKQQSHPVETVGKRKQDRGSRHKDKWRDGRHNMAGAIGTDIRYTVPSDLDYKQHIKMYRQQYTYKQKHKHSQQNGAAGHHGNGNHGGSVMTSSSNYRPSGDYVCYKPMTASNAAKHTHTPTQTGKLKYDHRQTSPKTLSFAHARTQSEPDILDLQHRYKLDPGAIKAALVANLGQLTNQSEPASSSQEANSSARIDIDTKPRDDTGDDPNGGLTKINGYWKNPVRSTSARSAKATIQSRSSGTVNLTPTSAVRHGANGVATSATRQQNVGNTSRVGSVANTSAAASRGAARQPIESVTLEPLVTSSTHSMPATILAQKTADESNGSAVPVPLTDRSPPHFAMAANNLRTLDLLSNMNSLDKQMWFDSRGRAYVSLATRYQPIRK